MSGNAGKGEQHVNLYSGHILALCSDRHVERTVNSKQIFHSVTNIPRVQYTCGTRSSLEQLDWLEYFAIRYCASLLARFLLDILRARNS